MVFVTLFNLLGFVCLHCVVLVLCAFCFFNSCLDIHPASFDLTLFETLLDLVGGLFSDWSCSKGSLSISLGGLGVHRTSLYASAAFISSLDQSKELVSDTLGHTPPTSIHLAPTLKDLAEVTGRVD